MASIVVLESMSCDEADKSVNAFSRHPGHPHASHKIELAIISRGDIKIIPYLYRFDQSKDTQKSAQAKRTIK